MGAKKPGSRSVSLYRDTNCHPSARERISPLPLPVLSVLCRELNDFAQRWEQLRLLLVRLHGAVQRADVPVNDADRLAGIAGVFCFPFTDLNALNKQPQQFRCQRINCCVLLCLFNESIHVRFARLKLCQRVMQFVWDMFETALNLGDDADRYRLFDTVHALAAVYLPPDWLGSKPIAS